MRLESLLEGIEYSGNITSCNIVNVSCDSRKITEGSIFVCIAGENFDGHDYALNALGKGAHYVVCEHDLGIKSQIIVSDTHYAYAKMCANINDNPAKKLKLIGVTGTNGKTTVTNVIKSVLSSAGYKVGLIGTIQNEIGDRVIPTNKTTPDAGEFQDLLVSMLKEKCDFVVTEVSSHALDQHRLADTQFEIGIFTNLTQDHLDYHKDMQSYFLSKKRLFDNCKIGIINIDDEYGKRLADNVPCQVITYSCSNNKADSYASDIKSNVLGVKFDLVTKNTKQKISFCTPGMFSVKNALAAAAVCRELGLSANQVAEGLKKCKPVKGRSEVINTGRNFTIICDYAHSPDGIKNILDSVNQYKQGRVVILFGCGGDRDSSKRPIMGEVASKNADFLIVTSDNPRTEDPEKIIDDILVGVKRNKTPFVCITDRRQAIKYAIVNAQDKDIIVLAGKGHEDYQILGTKKVSFDEREIVKDILNN